MISSFLSKVMANLRSNFGLFLKQIGLFCKNSPAKIAVNGYRYCVHVDFCEIAIFCKNSNFLGYFCVKIVQNFVKNSTGDIDVSKSC